MSKRPSKRVVHVAAVDTRTRILEAAERTFAERGYHGATLDDVARAVGLTKGAIYWNFENKADLFIALIDRHFTRGWGSLRAQLTALPAKQSPRTFMRQVFLAAVSQLVAEGPWLRLYMEFVSQTRDADVRRRVAAYYQSSLQRVAELIAALQRSGMVTDRLKPHELAALVAAMLDGLMISHLIDPASTDPVEVARRIADLVVP